MARKIALATGASWATIKDAKLHFSELLKSKPIGEVFKDSDAADLLEIYISYCSATSWKLASLPESFYPVYENGVGYASRCFGVTCCDGTTERFSMNKALRVIAQ